MFSAVNDQKSGIIMIKTFSISRHAVCSQPVQNPECAAISVNPMLEQAYLTCQPLAGILTV